MARGIDGCFYLPAAVYITREKAVLISGAGEIRANNRWQADVCHFVVMWS